MAEIDAHIGELMNHPVIRPDMAGFVRLMTENLRARARNFRHGLLALHYDTAIGTSGTYHCYVPTDWLAIVTHIIVRQRQSSWPSATFEFGFGLSATTDRQQWCNGTTFTAPGQDDIKLLVPYTEYGGGGTAWGSLNPCPVVPIITYALGSNYYKMINKASVATGNQDFFYYGFAWHESE